MKRVEVVVLPTALEHVRRIDDWWQRERLHSPGLFLEEFAAALQRLATAPSAGTIYTRSHRADLRRLLLPRTRHHVYYVVENERTAVMAVWHAARGVGPRL